MEAAVDGEGGMADYIVSVLKEDPRLEGCGIIVKPASHSDFFLPSDIQFIATIHHRAGTTERLVARHIMNDKAYRPLGKLQPTKPESGAMAVFGFRRQDISCPTAVVVL